MLQLGPASLEQAEACSTPLGTEAVRAGLGIYEIIDSIR